jgi:ABC-2 type transport system permease protein
MRDSLARIAAVAGIEWRRLLRARTTFTLLLLVPAMQVVLFGYAIRPTAATVGVVVAADSAVSGGRVVAALRAQPRLRVDGPLLAPGGAAAAVARGTALVGVEVPPIVELSRTLSAKPPLRVVIDAANPVLTAGVAARIEATYWRAAAEHAAPGDAGGIRIERLYNPAERTDWSFLPALIGVVVMISSIMLGSLSLARERESGTWEALLALPVTPIEAMAGKLLPYIVTGTAQGVVVLAAGIALFDLPARGGVAALIALLPLFAAAHLALGYAIASRAATQLEALQGAVAFYLPAMLLSGFLYPFETLPGWARTLGNIFPLTHFVRAARGGLLKGDDAMTVLAHGAPIAVFLAVMLAVVALTARRFD